MMTSHPYVTPAVGAAWLLLSSVALKLGTLLVLIA